MLSRTWICSIAYLVPFSRKSCLLRNEIYHPWTGNVVISKLCQQGWLQFKDYLLNGYFLALCYFAYICVWWYACAPWSWVDDFSLLKIHWFSMYVLNSFASPLVTLPNIRVGCVQYTPNFYVEPLLQTVKHSRIHRCWRAVGKFKKCRLSTISNYNTNNNN